MQPQLRLILAIAAVLVLAALEWAAPRPARTQPRLRRWAANLGLIAVDMLAQRLTLGAAAVSAAAVAQAHGWGVLPLLPLPEWARAVLGFLALDFAIYLQHRATHGLPLLWRLHRVHHTDLDLDVTTALRFHPGEILLSLLWKMLLAVALGVSPGVMLAFEAVLNLSALFTHANIRLPDRLDAALRRLICTPDFHRVHHSTDRAETESNYGFFLSLWDRICRTHRPQPRAGHTGMALGLPDHPNNLTLPALLLTPFRRIGKR